MTKYDTGDGFGCEFGQTGLFAIGIWKITVRWLLMKNRIRILLALAFPLCCATAKGDDEFWTFTPELTATVFMCWEHSQPCSGHATLSRTKKGAQVPETLELDMMVRRGTFRLDVDVASASGLEPTEAQALRVQGMDKAVVVDEFANRKTVVWFPGVRCYLETPMSEAVIAQVKKTIQSRRAMIPLGTEQIGSFLCSKNRLVEVGTTEQPKELAIAWLCPDLKGFPLRVECHTSEKVFVWEFNQVKLEEPHEGLFKVPEGFTKCRDLNEVRQIAVNRKNNERQQKQ